MSNPALSDRHLRFVTEYLKDLNASAAAARAGYSEKSRASTAVALMKNDAIRDRIRAELENLLAEARCTSLALIKERMAAAFFRADKMLGSGFEPLAPSEMEEATRNAVEVSTVMRKSGPVVRVKQPDRDRALRALERVHERLDRLNEQYYAKLEKEGRVPTLEEIERMDQEPAEPMREIAQNPLDFLGSAHKRAATPVVFGEKPSDLFGSDHAAALADARERAKTAVMARFGLSKPAAGASLPRTAAGASMPRTAAGASPPRPAAAASPPRPKAGISLPRPQASTWLLRSRADERIAA